MTKLFYSISNLALISSITFFSYCTKSTPIDIIDPPVPLAKACLSHSGLYHIKLPIQFDNCSENGNTYIWNFGDGTESILEHPTHIYNDSGTYVVQLLAFNTNGDSDTIIDTIEVSEVPPIKLTINSVLLTKWPETDNGTLWDPDGKPDLSLSIGQDSHPLYLPTSSFLNCIYGNSYLFDDPVEFPVSTTIMNEDIILQLDHAGGTANSKILYNIHIPIRDLHVFQSLKAEVKSGDFECTLNLRWTY